MLTAALLVVLSAEPSPPQTAAWVNLSPLAYVATLRRFGASAGASFVVAPRLVLTTDVAWVGAPHVIEQPCANAGWLSWVSAGVAIRPFGDEGRLDGYFVLPKVVVRIGEAQGRQTGRREDTCVPPYPNGTDVSVGLGFSIGWNWVIWRHLFLGVSGGGSLLACFNCTDHLGSAGRVTVKPVMDFDVGLRVGVSF